jgi:hypothetical protein
MAAIGARSRLAAYSQPRAPVAISWVVAWPHQTLLLCCVGEASRLPFPDAAQLGVTRRSALQVATTAS